MNTLQLQKRSQWLKNISRELGFSFCGVSEARFLEEEAGRLEQWLSANHHGQMAYMANHFEKRLDPRLLVPGAKTVVSLLFNYHNPVVAEDPTAPKVASYALGRDYHKVVKKRLLQLMQKLEAEYGQLQGRAFVDSAPVMEKQWAAQSGLGWTGKNTLLINKQQGSYFFLAELIIDLEMEADAPIRDYCGTCTACIDACPTEAITPYHLAAEKCISYLTIELKEAIPQEFQGKMDGWAFGCDICQQVCPWNRFAQKNNEADFQPKAFLNWTKEKWQEMDESAFNKVFEATPLKRAGFEKMKQNIRYASEGF
ncbi:MAG: tRNA epoxyqueuosine(34) reductase QueG [Bacteroidetes bacterium]|nr:tRNA epoxyqueuosine(34) reductase QueG [Bacteroidota bacterium]